MEVPKEPAGSEKNVAPPSAARRRLKKGARRDGGGKATEEGTRRKTRQSKGILTDRKLNEPVSASQSESSTSRKRPFVEMAEGDLVVLDDGSEGRVSKKRNHVGVWFHEKGRPAKQRVWIENHGVIKCVNGKAVNFPRLT